MITTADCRFDKQTGNLFASAFDFGGSFPNTVSIMSAHTGRVMDFVRITSDHPRYDEDGWDGELALYVPVEPCNVKLLTLCFEQ